MTNNRDAIYIILDGRKLMSEGDLEDTVHFMKTFRATADNSDLRILQISKELEHEFITTVRFNLTTPDGEINVSEVV